MKKIIISLLLLILVFNISSYALKKEEVIYLNLDYTGNIKNTYVVNSYDFEKKAKLVDYGEYKNIKNLTDSRKLKYESDKVELDNVVGKFFFQAELKNRSPWDINIKYYLDSKEVKAEDLLMKSGDLKIKINVKKANDEKIFNSFSLQSILMLDNDKATNIEADGAIIANVGNKKQITFVLLPKEEKELVLKAKIKDFQMEAIRFNALPFEMNLKIDIDKIDDPTKSINELKDGVNSLNEGAKSLSGGIKAFSEGLSALNRGAENYQKGISTLIKGNDELKNGSSKIKEGINNLHQGLKAENKGNVKSLIDGSDKIKKGIDKLYEGINAFSQSDTSIDFTQLIAANKQAIAGLKSLLSPNYQTAPNQNDRILLSQIKILENTVIALDKKARVNENKALKENIESGIQMLNQSIAALPDNHPSKPTLIARLKQLNGLKMIAENNMKALKAESQIITGLKTGANSLAVGAKSLKDNYKNFNEGIKGLTALESGSKKLKEGVKALNDNYKKFHAGLEKYLGGVVKLEDGANEISKGVFRSYSSSTSLLAGANSLSGGINTLNDGLKGFKTPDIKKYTKLLDKYKFDKYTLSSYTDDKNKVKLQQFIMQTKSIKKEEVKVEEKKVEKKSFIQKIFDIFR